MDMRAYKPAQDCELFETKSGIYTDTCATAIRDRGAPRALINDHRWKRKSTTCWRRTSSAKQRVQSSGAKHACSIGTVLMRSEHLSCLRLLHNLRWLIRGPWKIPNRLPITT